MRDDGDIAVRNRCLDGSEDGAERIAEGKAWVVDLATNARLKVQFFWPFRGDYWVIDLGDDYEYAVVGMPSRKYLWILSRTRTMDPETYAAIVKRAADHGYDVSKLLLTPQPS
jgi:apolipoprotein D and lipocalin family protein